MSSRTIIEGEFLGPFEGKDPRLIGQGVRHISIAQGRRDDMDMPVGKGGMRRFATNAPGEGGGGPGSTAGILLGHAGYAAWARDMHERGEKVPEWDQGTPYNAEALSPAEFVDRLLEYDRGDLYQGSPTLPLPSSQSPNNRMIQVPG